MGDEVFLNALGMYAREMKHKNAGIADFARALETASGRNWDDYLVLSLRGINEYSGSGIEWFE
jgi:aminopeptidase N